MNNILPEYTKIKDTYTIDKYLGAGTFGTVYRVRHKYMGFQALKVFNPGSIPKEQETELFNEAYILSKITHENVVRVYEANTFTLDRTRYCYIAMEYVEGCSLDKYLEKELPISIETALEIQQGICAGLASAHKLEPPVVHRDVKPQNIMMSMKKKQNIIKVSDFGLAKHVDPLTRITESGGTLAYFPPEGFWNYVSPASDVYSAGIIFYIMLTGIAPFKITGNYNCTKKEEVKAAIKESRNKTPERPSKYNNTIDPELDNLVLKALSPEIKKRYQDAGEFLGAIKAYVGAKSTAMEGEIEKALALGKQYKTLGDAINILEGVINRQPKENQEIYAKKYKQILMNWKKGIIM